VSSRLITLLLLNGTILPMLVTMIVAYGYLRGWVLAWNIWAEPGIARLRPLVIGLQIIGLFLMVLWNGKDAIIGWWADPWPLGDAFSNYQSYASPWISNWLKATLLGLPALYAISERWIRRRWHTARSQRWATIIATLGMMLAFLSVTTPFSLRVFSE
jgi:hypothetical protein